MWIIKSAPSVEPVSLTEAKAHLNVTGTGDDALIGGLITAARELAEGFTRRAFVEQTIELKMDSFPANNYPIELPRPPLISISSITYLDADGTLRTMTATTEYLVNTHSQPGRVYLAYDQSWPTTRTLENAVTITFKAGYGSAAANVPQRVKQAILLLVGHWYANREEIVLNMSVNQMPWAAEMILQAVAVW